MPIKLKDLEVAKQNITADQLKKISNAYSEWAKAIEDKAWKYAMKDTDSSELSEQQMLILRNQLTAQAKQIASEVNSIVKDSMYLMADEVVEANKAWLKSLGFPTGGVDAAFSNTKAHAVKSLMTGQVYESGWSLSKRIWGDLEIVKREAYRVVAGGLAMNESAYEISNKLAQYVSPKAKKQWNLRDKDGKMIYPRKVDYNAQRLVRTLTQHTYQQTFVGATKKNPFVESYTWIANGSRVCEICKARNGQVFKKDELPLDHPNGMCVMQPNVDEDALVDKLADWINSDAGTFPEIDNFAKELGYSPIGDVQSFINKYGMSNKTQASWFQGLPKVGQAEARALKNKSGLTWEDWYNKNIYSGAKAVKVQNVVNVKTPTPVKTQKTFFEENIKKIKTKLKNELSIDELDDFVNILKNTDKDFHDIYIHSISKLKKVGLVNPNSGPYFSKGENHINVNFKDMFKQAKDYKMENKFHVFLHESGHAIDAHLGKVSKSKIFLDAFDDDIKNFVKASKSMRRDDIIKMFADNNSRGIQDISSAIRNMKGADYELSEIVKNKIRWSHSNEYWQRSDVKLEAASEMFAHISASKISEIQTQYMKTWFPKSLEAFDDIIAKNNF